MKEIDWTDEAYESIVSILGTRTGLTFREAQREATKMGIANAMKRSDVTDSSAYAKLLAYDVEALDNLIVELTVGETYFFREAAQFEGIRREILPEILGRKGRWDKLRLWSAACASGEEPYSLAMLCHKHGLANQCEILATDISSEALSKARRATYRDWSLRGELGAEAKDYLKFDKGVYSVDEKIRRMVRFEFLNLAMDVYPSHVTSTEAMDLILCRNVLIYLSRSTIREVAQRFFRCLADGGWLITASGDPPVGDFAPFETTVTDFGVFLRKPKVAKTLEAVVPQTAGDSKELRDDSYGSTPGNKPHANRDNQSTVAIHRDTRWERDEAHAALARGDYARAVELSESHPDSPAACICQVKSLANLSTEAAIRKCTLFATRHPLSTELHYLHAVLLMEMNLDVEAVQAVQRVVFLDRSLAIAHFLLGSILQRRGALDGARRAFRNARDLAAAQPPDEIVPLSEHETSRLLARAATNHLRAIDAALGATS